MVQTSKKKTGRRPFEVRVKFTERDALRKRFLDSPHIEWDPFAKEMGFHADVRSQYPVSEWVEEKRRLALLGQSEEVAQALFYHTKEWQKRLFKSLKERPEQHEKLAKLIDYQIHDIAEDIREDIEAKKNGQRGSGWKKRKVGDLTALAMALSTLTASEHKSLMIDRWKIEDSEALRDQLARQASGEIKEDGTVDTKWEVVLVGSSKGLDQKELSKWYDKDET